jgi:hypothetical protein
VGSQHADSSAIAPQLSVHAATLSPLSLLLSLSLHVASTVSCFLLQGLAPLVDVREVEECILGLGGTVNYKHFYDPDELDESDDDDDPGDGGEHIICAKFEFNLCGACHLSWQTAYV